MNCRDVIIEYLHAKWQRTRSMFSDQHYSLRDRYSFSWGVD
jgi:hypothetical protein